MTLNLDLKVSIYSNLITFYIVYATIFLFKGDLMQSTKKKTIGFLITTTANLLNNTINNELRIHKIAIEQRAILEIIESKSCALCTFK